MRIWSLSLIAALFAACSSQPAPVWQDAAYTQLTTFTERYLGGDERAADIHFEKALGHIAKTGDPALMGRAWLTRCALRTAALIEGNCVEARKYAGDPHNDAYRALLEGAAANGAALPDRYRDLAAAIAKGSLKAVNAAIDDIDEPVSRLVGAGVAVRRGVFDAATLELAARTASENGWKLPLAAYLRKLKNIYAANGDAAGQASAEERLSIVEQATP